MACKDKNYLYVPGKSDLVSVFAVVILGLAVPSLAASRATVDKVQEANDAYIAGRYEDAIKAYELVGVDNPDMPEVSYNMGLAYYRMRDFEKARELFNESLSTRDLDLEARAKFNLGNVAYSQALEKLSAIPEAIEKAKQAISHYRDVLEIHPEDIDARANIETAQLLVKDLLDKRKKEEEKQKQEQDKQEQEKQNQQCDNQQQQQDNKDQEGEKKDQDKKENEGDKQDQQQQQNQQQGQQQADEQQQQESQPQPTEVKEEMTQEQAERMLQAVRDREAKRREEQARKLRAKRVPVSRDW